MATLYFEASDEDNLQKAGFSKDGKHQNPQIFLVLLVGQGGYAIRYDIFAGNIYECRTLIHRKSSMENLILKNQWLLPIQAWYLKTLS